jgi:hypothetical protein
VAEPSGPSCFAVAYRIMQVELFYGQPCLSLVCGRCPKRRLLHYVVRLGDAVVPVQVGRRKARPSVPVDSSIDEALAGGPLRQRCKDGHAWEIPQTELRVAYQRAVAHRQRDIVAGVDV